jgi:hypothetical protein
MKGFLRRPERIHRAPLDPQKKAAIRSSLKWLALSCVPLFVGLAWMLFATGHWAGSRGVFRGMSRVMIGVGTSSALTIPFLRALNPTPLRPGWAAIRYTTLSIWVAIASAAVLLVASVVVPQ